MEDVVERARALAPEIATRADESERGRRVPVDIVQNLARAGLFRMLVPRSIGGLEVDPGTLVRAIEVISQADGSAGWCLMIGATTGLVSAYLPESTAREIFTADPEMVVGGVFHPRGRAGIVENGYQVSGRWPFASGCQHCGWLVGGCILFDGKDIHLRADGLPEARMMIFPAPEVEILDTWHVSGLRGTGSNDIAVENLFVPRERSVWFSTDRPRESGTLYAFPPFGLLAAGVAAVALGMAAGAIEDLVTLATTKTPTGSRRPLSERSAAQGELARAQAELGSSRTFLLATIEGAWDEATHGGEIALPTRAKLRIAATHAVRASATVIDRMYELAGASSIYETSPLQRRFRDIHAATQHVLVAPPTFELAGRILFGLETDTEML